MPNGQGPTGTGTAKRPEAPAEPGGDVRRGGWILVLIGVVLLLVAVFLALFLGH